MNKNIIIGAGFTGLAAAWKTGFETYEAKPKAGGICRSYYTDGFRFENGGGHWIFGSGQTLNLIKKYADLKYYGRDAGILIDKIFSYPIQSLAQKQGESNPKSLKGWMHNRFDDTLCNLFFDPFNKKYTANLYDLVVQDDEVKSPTKGKGYNNTFCYPVGGLDKLADKFAVGSKIFYNKRLVKIKLKERIAVFDDGEEIEYDRMISTLPLTETLKMAGLDHHGLISTSVIVLNIGSERGDRCPDNHWLYVPYCDSGYFRVGFYSNVDPSFAPEGCVSIYVEKAFLDVHADTQTYKNLVVEELTRLGYIKNWTVVSESVVPCAYTWMSDKRLRDVYIAMLKKHGIESIGRYGKWKFQGILDSINDGLGVLW